MEALPGFRLGIYATFVTIFIVVVAGLAAQVALVMIGAAVAGSLYLAYPVQISTLEV